MSIVNIDLEEIRVLSASDMKLLEYDSVQEIENENNVLKTGVIILLLVGAFIAYQWIKEETKNLKLRLIIILLIEPYKDTSIIGVGF